MLGKPSLHPHLQIPLPTWCWANLTTSCGLGFHFHFHSKSAAAGQSLKEKETRNFSFANPACTLTLVPSNLWHSAFASLDKPLQRLPENRAALASSPSQGRALRNPLHRPSLWCAHVLDDRRRSQSLRLCLEGGLCASLCTGSRCQCCSRVPVYLMIGAEVRALGPVVGRALCIPLHRQSLTVL